MMVPRLFSYPNLVNIKNLLLTYSVFIVVSKKNISKNYSRVIFIKELLFINVHPIKYLWTHDMGIWNGILINCI